MKPKRTRLKRYAAKLLFQYRIVKEPRILSVYYPPSHCPKFQFPPLKGPPPKRRTCEERIITFQARDAQEALAHAKKRGRQEETGQSRASNFVIEFIGVRELLCCDNERDEVWYDMVEMMRPMERRRKLIPPESKLCAIRNKD